jgi:hypothetical protein
MNTHTGWIKLYRCLLDDAVCQKSAYFHLWVVLLLMAAHKEQEFIFNNQLHKLRPGQLLTGRKKLSELTGIPETTIERILKCMENGRKIGQQKFKNFRIITLTNWDFYQNSTNDGHPNGSCADNARAPSGSPADTYKT